MVTPSHNVTLRSAFNAGIVIRNASHTSPVIEDYYSTVLNTHGEEIKTRQWIYTYLLNISSADCE